MKFIFSFFLFLLICSLSISAPVDEDTDYDMPLLAPSSDQQQSDRTDNQLFDAEANDNDGDKMFDASDDQQQYMNENERLQAEREEEDPDLFTTYQDLDTGIHVQHVVHSVHARVTFAATQRTTFLHNGRVVAFTSHYTETKSITITVKKGDVLGFQASGKSSPSLFPIDLLIVDKNTWQKMCFFLVLIVFFKCLFDRLTCYRPWRMAWNYRRYSNQENSYRDRSAFIQNQHGTVCTHAAHRDDLEFEIDQSMQLEDTYSREATNRRYIQ